MWFIKDGPLQTKIDYGHLYSRIFLLGIVN